MLTTADPDLDRRFRLLRQHGMSVPDTVRHSAAQVIQEEYLVLGFNYRMTDIQAAIGREQLVRLPAMVARRRELAKRYTDHLGGVPGVIVPHQPDGARANWQSYVIRVAPGSQRSIMQQLLDERIATRRGVMNAHRQPAYPDGTWRAPGPLLRSEEAQETAIVLPLFHQLTDADQDRVIAAVKRAAARPPESWRSQAET
jgi:dTDP-4-amino-4,6-dideoxygalactose transaminase